MTSQGKTIVAVSKEIRAKAARVRAADRIHSSVLSDGAGRSRSVLPFQRVRRPLRHPARDSLLGPDPVACPHGGSLRHNVNVQDGAILQRCGAGRHRLHERPVVLLLRYGEHPHDGRVR